MVTKGTKDTAGTGTTPPNSKSIVHTFQSALLSAVRAGMILACSSLVYYGVIPYFLTKQQKQEA